MDGRYTTQTLVTDHNGRLHSFADLADSVARIDDLTNQVSTATIDIYQMRGILNGLADGNNHITTDRTDIATGQASPYIGISEDYVKQIIIDVLKELGVVNQDGEYEKATLVIGSDAFDKILDGGGDAHD